MPLALLRGEISGKTAITLRHSFERNTGRCSPRGTHKEKLGDGLHKLDEHSLSELIRDRENDRKR